MGSGKKPRFPYSFEKNGRKGKIYLTSKGTFKTYFVFAHKQNQNVFATFEGAKSYLSKEFDKLDTNAADSASQYPLSRDRKYYHELEELLGTEAGATLRDAVDFYLSARPKTKFKPITVKDCSEKFLADKKNDNLSNFHTRSLKKHLRRFGETFGTKKIHEITSEQIKDWLHSQKDKRTNRKWSIKHKRNVLGSLVTFARYAKDTYKAFPHVLSPTEFELVRKPKNDIKDEVEVYSPEELSRQLKAAIEHDVEVIPVILLGAFFGLRPTEAHGEEMTRPKIRWDAFDWQNKLLHVRFQKVRSKPTRSIPIHPIAALWLAPFKKLKGSIWKKSAAYDERLTKICSKANCSKIWNGYRHSYASYRIVHLKYDYAAVAAELGNSVQEVIKSYRRNVLPKTADEWFSVKPPRGYGTKIKAYLSKVSV